MDSNSGNWGGKRKGAGRPKSNTVKLDGVRVTRETWALLVEQAHRENTTPEELTVRVLESYLTAPLYRKM